MDVEDDRLGQLLRLIRQRNDLTQVQLAAMSRVPLADVKRIEAGHAGDVRLNRIRKAMQAVGGRARLVPWWQGAAADELLDARHARLTERGSRYLQGYLWLPHIELTFSEFGERGSIDIFATNEARRAVAVCEVKTAFGSLEEMNRVLDVKERLAPTIAFKRFGWRPLVVGRILIVPRDGTIRRVIASHSTTMSSIYPGRGREIRSWLKNPITPLRAIWFVSYGTGCVQDLVIGRGIWIAWMPSVPIGTNPNRGADLAVLFDPRDPT